LKALTGLLEIFKQLLDLRQFSSKLHYVFSETKVHVPSKEMAYKLNVATLDLIFQLASWFISSSFTHKMYIKVEKFASCQQPYFGQWQKCPKIYIVRFIEFLLLS
jgi:hypothetical protein